jgi:hypothetical protein
VLTIPLLLRRVTPSSRPRSTQATTATTARRLSPSHSRSHFTERPSPPPMSCRTALWSSPATCLRLARLARCRMRVSWRRSSRTWAICGQTRRAVASSPRSLAARPTASSISSGSLLTSRGPERPILSCNSLRTPHRAQPFPSSMARRLIVGQTNKAACSRVPLARSLNSRAMQPRW